MRQIVFTLTLAAALGLAWRSHSAAQAPNFDRLKDGDRKQLQQRFEKEVWPLMNRGGKQGCVGCHSGGIVSALKLTGQPGDDFAMLVRDGFFLPDDAGSILSRLTDPDPERRMPRGKAKAWTPAEVKVLETFVTDLNAKQQK